MQPMAEIGPGRWAHASGALWLPEARTVIIADAHLGYGWAQRRRGELGPLVDETMPEKIAAVLDELKPSRVVMLGDVVHAPEPAPAERQLVSRTLEAIAARAELVLVRGNHDRGLAADFTGFAMTERWETAKVVAVHGDVLPARALRRRHLIAGHWHPAYRVRDAAGVSHRLPVFAVSPGLTVLPAFSGFAAGLNLAKGLPEEWNNKAGGRFRLFAATGRVVKELGKAAASSGPGE